MLVSKSWIEQFVTLPKGVGAKELATDLTMKTVEVEEVVTLGEHLENVVVGLVETAQKHPNADKLKLCSVAVGAKDPVQIVCGGSNVVAGMKVALAHVGAMVRWHGEGDLIELKPAEIRGVKSYGMICASEEIGLAELFPMDDPDGILDISFVDAKPGTPLKKALCLDDTVLDIDNKSMTHRPDLWGHYGLAREVAAMYGVKLKAYAPPAIKEGSEQKVTVQNKEKALCPMYSTVMIDGLAVGSSPDWLKQKLIAVGMDSINNVVDVTNYVMAELGQPLHAFDARHIKNHAIIVRKAKKMEPFVALGGAEYELTSDMLVIVDADRPVAVAGVKGSENSGVMDDTTTIILEAANFDATSVRKTSSMLGLRTDASARYEKSLDPHMPALAMQRAVELLKKVCPEARVVSKIAKDGAALPKPRAITFTHAFLNTKIGASISKKQITETLKALGFDVAEKNETYTVTVPTWRATKDVEIAEDIVEEVARMYGYGEIEVQLPALSIAPAPIDPLQKTIRTITQVLAGECGYTETYALSFVSEEWLQKIGEDPKKYIELDNPVAKDRPYLRRHIIDGILEQARKNAREQDRIALFEIGKVFRADEKGVDASKKKNDMLPGQPTLAGFAVGEKGNDTPFYEAADAVRRVLRHVGEVPTFEKKHVDHPLVHSERFAEIMLNKKVVGRIAEVHPLKREDLDLPYPVAIVELDVDVLAALSNETKPYTPLSPYPAVTRDVAFVVEQDTSHDAVIAAITQKSDLIASVSLFDVYQGKGVDDGHKSMAYRIVYRAADRTLESKDVDAVHATVVNTLKKTFNAHMR